MGVLTCQRGQCENIMSDHYSHRFGYLCRDCFDELVAGGPQDIEAFMRSDRRHDPMREAWPDIVEQEFPRR